MKFQLLYYLFKVTKVPAINSNGPGKPGAIYVL